MLGVVEAPPEYLAGSKLHLDVEHPRVWVYVDLHDVRLGPQGLSEIDDLDVVSFVEFRGDELPRSRVRERRVEPTRWVDHLPRLPLRRTLGTEVPSVPRPGAPRSQGELLPG